MRFLGQVSDDFPDWMATVAFYAAVELVEKLLAKHGHHSADHFDRKTALKKYYPNRHLNQAYYDLYNASLDARYLPQSKCPSAKEVREILIERRLRHISQYVSPHA